MKTAGRINAEAIALAGEACREGVTTKHLDDIVRAHIERSGGIPTELGFCGFPASACISVNDEIIHGIPSAKRVLHEGDIVKIDVCTTYHGYIADSADTFLVGNASEEAKRLVEATKKAFFKGLEQIREGNRIGDIGHAVEAEVKAHGFSVIRKYVGHGVGREMHEQPDVPNYGTPGRGPRLVKGMTIAVEPMVSAGSFEVKEKADGWTVVTVDHSLTAHYEHTVALTEEGAVLLTRLEG